MPSEVRIGPAARSPALPVLGAHRRRETAPISDRVDDDRLAGPDGAQVLAQLGLEVGRAGAGRHGHQRTEMDDDDQDSGALGMEGRSSGAPLPSQPAVGGPPSVKEKVAPASGLASAQMRPP